MHTKTSAIQLEGFNINGRITRTSTTYTILCMVNTNQYRTSILSMGLFITYSVCTCAINIGIYYMIDMWFSYAPALHTVEYKSNHYAQQKKLAVKKFSKRGYMGV